MQNFLPNLAGYFLRLQIKVNPAAVLHEVLLNNIWFGAVVGTLHMSGKYCSTNKSAFCHWCYDLWSSSKRKRVWTQRCRLDKKRLCKKNHPSDLFNEQKAILGKQSINQTGKTGTRPEYSLESRGTKKPTHKGMIPERQRKDTDSAYIYT